jgi:hypothetical protein
MKKPLAAYLIAGLIFATAVAYFISASFGERLERSNHEAKAAVETGHESSEVTTPQPQTTKNNHNVAGGQVKQTLNNTSSVNESSSQRNKEATSSNGNESERRGIEFPLFLTAGTAYNGRAVAGDRKEDNKNSIHHLNRGFSIIDWPLHFISHYRITTNRFRTNRILRLNPWSITGCDSCLLWICLTNIKENIHKIYSGVMEA